MHEIEHRAVGYQGGSEDYCPITVPRPISSLDSSSGSHPASSFWYTVQACQAVQGLGPWNLAKALTSGSNRLLRDVIKIRWSTGVHQQTNATTNHLQPFATILRRRRRLILLSKL